VASGRISETFRFWCRAPHPCSRSIIDPRGQHCPRIRVSRTPVRSTRSALPKRTASRLVRFPRSVPDANTIERRVWTGVRLLSLCAPVGRSPSVVVGEGFRNQPRAMHGNLPNYGRKALLFSDSRQEAAMLAANLRRNHGNDLFRQLMYRALHSCAPCAGTGYIDEQAPYVIGQPQQTIHRMPHLSGHWSSRGPYSPHLR
jgi:hypothetical protein